jgi:hypothetical protein
MDMEWLIRRRDRGGGLLDRLVIPTVGIGFEIGVGGQR